MIALLDTHILLWWFEAPKRLSASQRHSLKKANDRRALGISDVTIWEIAMLTLPLEEWSGLRARPRLP